MGKVEAGIPEDDPRNPAVIADLVGDNVGDCSARGADLFESIAAEIISAMILGGSMARKVGLPETTTAGFIVFPLVVHALDCFVSAVGILSVTDKGVRDDNKTEDPYQVLKRGYHVSLGLSVLTFFLATRCLLAVPDAPNAWFHFFGCGKYFPIYHIPPTDCPYETDIYFFTIRGNWHGVRVRVRIHRAVLHGLQGTAGVGVSKSQLRNCCAYTLRKSDTFK